MRPAILFWFYKDAELCANRLEILRRFNPRASIFGLFGGELAEADRFRRRLGGFLDDFYAFPHQREARWKWYHGDQLLASWYRERGASLRWETIFVAQWDMLVFGEVGQLFDRLNPGELLFSGLRPLKEVEAWWWYTRPGSAEREECLRFLDFVRLRHGFSDEPMCGEFIVVCLPRPFLERYAQIPEPDLGFLEYKIPTYARIFGTPFCRDPRYDPWWGDDPASRGVPLLGRALNSETQEVPLRSIVCHLAWPAGRRIFHPVFQPYPHDAVGRLRAVVREVVREELKPRWWRLQRRLSRSN